MNERYKSIISNNHHDKQLLLTQYLPPCERQRWNIIFVSYTGHPQCVTLSTGFPSLSLALYAMSSFTTEVLLPHLPYHEQSLLHHPSLLASFSERISSLAFSAELSYALLAAPCRCVCQV